VEQPPRELGRALLVLEVDRDRKPASEWVRVTCSRPGTEGTFTRVWPSTVAGMAGPEFDDMAAWIAQTVINALTHMGSGVQEVFKFGA
jgi:hypothetical protein